MTRPLRVVAIGASGQLGGTERVLLDLAAHAPDLGLDLRVVVAADGPLIAALDDLAIRNAVVKAPYRLLRSSQQPGHLWTAPPALLGLLSWSRRVKNHPLVSGTDLSYTIAFKAHLAAMVARLKPVLWHLHEFPPTSTGRTWRFLANRVPGALIANSTAAGEAWSSRLGTASQNLTVVHNGVDLERFVPRPKTKWLHDLLHIPHERRLVGMPAVLAKWKGQLEVEQAFAMIEMDFPDVDLVFVGGPIYDTVAEREYGKEIGRRVRKRGSGVGGRGSGRSGEGGAGSREQGPAPLPRVHLLPFQEEIERVYPEFDVTVHYSLRPEAFGRVVVESMACGVPVIAADEGGPREILGSSRDGGWLVEPRDPIALAAALREALQHEPHHMTAIGEKGRQRATERFSARRFAEEIAAVFHRVASAVASKEGPVGH